jgi:hypothetical protein
LARSEDPPEDGGKFLPRVTTHTDICMIHFPAEMSRYRFAPNAQNFDSGCPIDPRPRLRGRRRI